MLTLMSLLTFSVGCTSVAHVPFPPELVQDCEVHHPEGRKWIDIAVVAAKRKGSIEECNARWQAIREEINRGQ